MTKTSPAHYQKGSIDVWDFIIDQDMDYLTGCAVKYLCRKGSKPGESRFDDLLKAQAYIHKLVLTELDQHVNPRSSRPSDPIQESDGATDCN